MEEKEMPKQKYTINLIGGDDKQLSAEFLTSMNLEDWVAYSHCGRTNTLTFFTITGVYVFIDLNGCMFMIEKS